MSDENFEGDEGFKNLRSAYDKLKADKAAADKIVSDYESEKRNLSLTQILSAKGLKETVASHYTGDVSEEAVTKWATDLGLITASDATEDANSDAARRAAAASGGTQGSRPGDEQTPGQRVLGDPEEILNALNTLTYEQLVEKGYMPKDPRQI